MSPLGHATLPSSLSPYLGSRMVPGATHLLLRIHLSYATNSGANDARCMKPLLPSPGERVVTPHLPQQLGGVCLCDVCYQP